MTSTDREITMTSLDELLDSATPQRTDVTICMDGSLAAQRETLINEAKQALEKGKAADDRLGQKPRWQHLTEQVREIEERIGERLLTIRISQLPGSQWASLKMKHPVGKTPGPYDRAQGFNVEAVARQALLTHGKRVVGDEVEDINAEQWQRIFDTISGGDFETLILGTLGVNQLSGQMTVAALSKGSRRTDDSAQS